MSNEHIYDWSSDSDFRHGLPSHDTIGHYEAAIVPHALTSQSPYFHDQYLQQSHWCPQVISYGPRSGCAGTMVTVQIRAPEWPPQRDGFVYSLMFGATQSWATGTNAWTGEDYLYHLGIQALAPATYHHGSVPVTLRIQDWEGLSISVIPFGTFSYLPSAAPSAYVTTSSPMAASSEETRLSSQPQPLSRGRTFAPPDVLTPAIAQRSPQMEQQYSANAPYAPYEAIPLPSPTHHTAAASARMRRQATPSSRSSTVHRRHRSPTSGNIRHETPPIKNPVLVRTSLLQNAHSDDNASHLTKRYNPYLVYPSHKALLRLDGNLDGVAHGWSEEERASGRRLVQFSRDQTANTITLRFHIVTAADRTPGSICVNCIWWNDKKEAFMTSVDTIFLLERIIGSRFTVEEKNRIRRNLEGFHPLTVSKAKCESFFTLIMRFPPPKPRNIEKDIKVFPWRIISLALKKIVGKYVSLTPPLSSSARAPD